jgi:hypothetical protein
VGGLVRLLRERGVLIPEEATAVDDRWSAFMHWAQRSYARPDFASQERDYKVLIAARLREAKTAIEASADDLVRGASAPHPRFPGLGTPGRVACPADRGGGAYG